jgi:catechol 2,3-dioxygenase-like lactoylglutathione lyase family enzyme
VSAIRLQHVSVQVPEALLSECAAFYEHVLGMEPIPNLAGRAWFRFGDGDHVHLLEGPAAESSMAHLALQVDDLPATLSRARAAGAALREADRIWGQERWFVRDPAGNLVELFAVAPPDPPGA